MHNKPKILVICSRNKKRSATAESIYRGSRTVEVRSAGTSQKANHVVSHKDAAWADIILCMEEKHSDKMSQLFPDAQLPKIIVLDIPDEYEFMDPELVDMLRSEIESHL